MTKLNRVIIGLGSSLGDKKNILNKASFELQKLGSDYKISSYLETEPWGGVAKNIFLNAVCVFYSDINPFELLVKLQDIENNLGRTRDIRWEDRTIDLDILYYGKKIIKTPDLIIPHPRIIERDFVKKPILELIPSFVFKNETKQIMGILNITPDSFYDGGKYENINAVEKQIKNMLKSGVDIIDVGGFSSRPGAIIPSVEEELSRILPVLELLERYEIEVSVDTCRSLVVKEIVKFKNIKYINDISGLSDEKILNYIKETDISYVLMHINGTPENMQENLKNTDIIGKINSFFLDKIIILEKAGIRNIILDPGFGFGKTLDDNYKILNNLDIFTKHGYKILAGLSRKSMIYKLLDLEAKDILHETIALNLLCLENGADVLRVHDIEEHVKIRKIFYKIINNK